MNRKVNLISHQSQNIDGIENISIENINSIYNYSCELLLCKYFNVFDNSVVTQVLDALIDKIRPNGQLIIGLIDLRQICIDFIHRKITNEDFFMYMKNTHNYFGVDDLISKIDNTKNCIVIETKYTDYINFVTISKNKP